MPFQIIRNDITKVKVDAIVNTANPEPVVGGGTDRAVYKAAGEKELLAERKKIGHIDPGQAVETPAFRLPAKYIIHTVGPAWVDGNHGEREVLHSCYVNSMKLATKLRAKSIAFPLIATGVYGFPKDEALDIAMAEIGKYLLTHELEVVLVVFDKKAFQVSGDLVGKIKAYIDEHGVEQAEVDEYSIAANDPKNWQHMSVFGQGSVLGQAVFLPTDSSGEIDLASVVGQTEEAFSPALLRLIDEKGIKKYSTCYKNANVSRQFFNKIISNPKYRPKKQTVCAFALALELNLTETKELLEKAGYSLSHSIEFDKAIECCIIHKIYNVQWINEALFEMGLPLLGSGGAV